jgi:prepilin-type processing-associated H-X9-DG protein
LSDLIVAVLLILTLGTMTLAQVGRSREIANRVKCASNLRQIGQALLLFSNDNRGAFPRALYDQNNPTPTWGTPYEGNPNLKAIADVKAVSPTGPKSQVCPKPNDVTAALFILLRTQDISSDVFICPSTGLLPFKYGGGKNTPLNWTNWPGNKAIAEHLSYSYQNPYPSKAAVAKGWKLNNAIGAEFAVASDMNPGIDALLKLTPSSAIAEMKKGNSSNHDFDGQNILYGDGHVAFEKSCFVGVNGDNIYTFGDSGTNVKDKGGDGIIGSSVGPNDSILLPTAKDVGVLDAAGQLTDAARKQRQAAIEAMRPVTPAEQDASRKRVIGVYTSARGTLTIADGKVTLAGQNPASFAMKFAGIDRNKVLLNLFDSADPTVPKGQATITLTDIGIDVSGPAELNGQWQKKQ